MRDFLENPWVGWLQRLGWVGNNKVEVATLGLKNRFETVEMYEKELDYIHVWIFFIFNV